MMTAVAVAPRVGPRNDILVSLVVAVVATGLSYLIGLGAGWIDSVNLLEAAAVFTSYSCTYLCVKERRINYPIGALSTALYCILFVQSGLLASAVLNGYLTLSLIYGWFRWRSDAVTRPVSRVEIKWVPVYLLATGAAYAGALGLNTHFGGSFAWTDTVILVLTILAQFLLDNKKLENWAVWAVVNVFAIYTYFTAGLFIVGVQYIFFLANTLYGWYVWNQSRKAALVETVAVRTPIEIHPGWDHMMKGD
jgi:nicotinamide mononucleotide transporter